MNCSTVNELIAPYIDQELSEETLIKMNEHFEKCNSCRTELKAHMGTHRLLAEKLEHTPVNDDVRDKIIAKMREQETASPNWLFKKIHIPLRPVTGFAIAASLIFGILFIGDIVKFTNPDITIRPIVINSGMSPVMPDGLLATVTGEVVCVGCYIRENYNAEHDCDIKGHIFGFQSSDGNLWSFTHNEQAENLIKIDEVTGKKVKIEGKLYYSAHFINIDHYSFVEN